MTTYDYKCSICDHATIVEHSVDDSPVILCKLCEAVMRKVYSSPAVIFNGGGWGKDAR